MPSPIGHALAAAAIGLAIAPARAPGPAGRIPTTWRSAAIFAAVGVAPDLDLLVGRHSMETHSIGAALVVASVAAWLAWPVAFARWRIWLAVLAAWMSHPILDALSLDTSPPLGVMIFWPFESGFHQTGWSVFLAISRRYWLPEFVWHNALAVIREVLLLGPPFLVAAWLARARAGISTGRSPAPTSGRGGPPRPSA